MAREIVRNAYVHELFKRHLLDRKLLKDKYNEALASALACKQRESEKMTALIEAISFAPQRRELHTNSANSLKHPVTSGLVMYLFRLDISLLLLFSP